MAHDAGATTTKPVPAIDADFDKLPEIGDELLQQINAMREVGPVIWSEHARAWIVTRHEDLVQAYSGKMPLSNVRYHPPFASVPEAERKKRFPQTMRTIGFWPVFTDPPEHTRLRKLLTRAFGRTVVENLRPLARANIDRILTEAGAKGEVEFVNDVARAVTGRTILHLLGMSEDFLPRLEQWSARINLALGSPNVSPEALDQLEETVAEMRILFERELARRREHPTEDFISQMVLSSDGSDQLTDEEIIGVCYVVLIAGHDTTMNSMSLGTIALARHPEAVQYMLAHPDGVLNSIMEVARFVAMSTVQPRVVAEDFQWHGQSLKRGDYMYLLIAGANRDPRVFSNPERLDLTRDTDKVLVFGTGIHHCIGHLLAKMQLCEFFPELFRRFDVEILDKKIEFAPPVSQRGPARLHVRLTPRR